MVWAPDEIRLRAGFGDVGCLRALRSLNDLKFYGVTFLQGFVAVTSDCGIVDENICSIISSDKSIALRIVEPLDGSLHADVLLA